MSSTLDFSVYSSFVRPFNMERVNVSKNTDVFTLHPIEIGYGVTIGNSLRRVLLSSIRGVCIDWISFDGNRHEFSSIHGISEDVVNIALNFKNIVLKADNLSESRMFTIKISKSGSFTAGDIKCPDGVEVVNKECYLFTVSSETVDLSLTICIKPGFGIDIVADDDFVDHKIGRIYLNKIYTPIKNVSMEISQVTYNGRTDYEKLMLKVETNGSISPVDAVGIASSVMREILLPFINFDQSVSVLKDNKVQGNTVSQKGSSSLSGGTKSFTDSGYQNNKSDATPIEYVEFSVRTSNCLKKMSIKFLSDLAAMSPMQLLSMKNFGKKSLNEVIQKLSEYGFKLKDD
ncbi:DNA-directed RNA polymerase subunit alpha [Candidatus Deianiraea vastatrix]|uniref:DNA-directed RNA polymerase subunit alpha n=1 Tax=Candidatus Deianiraea vastatrix TaxID=2163644 RepID=A0A5B8XCV4_9RICK|nr:DNA-directed RNA polymerase subunit alpha [Candidatus Deianiraea vastatrix]QED23209.1 DNA-directed RNA polymerase subunit alpha [Candidatus Deianiraea vastatrix]